MTVAGPLPPEALALLPVPLAAPVLEELDGLLLHAAVAAASASASAWRRPRTGCFSLRFSFTRSIANAGNGGSRDLIVGPAYQCSGMAYIIKDPYDLN